MNKVLAVGYLAAAAFFFIGGWGILVSAALFILGMAYFVNMFAFLGRFFDPLFKKRPGENVVGTMEPAADVRQAIVLCAHHDSSPVCNFFEKFPGAYAFRTFLPVAFYVVATVGAVVASAEPVLRSRRLGRHSRARDRHRRGARLRRARLLVFRPGGIARRI